MKYTLGLCLRPVVVFVLASLLSRLPAEAATNTVLNLNDGLVSGTLRFMIANSAPGDTIVFNSGLTGTIALTSGELVLNKNLTLLGPGPKVITVSGNNTSRVFFVTNATAHIAALTIANGRLVGANGAVSGAPGESVYGAGIFNAGTLTVTDCNFLQHYAQGGAGFNGNFTTSGNGGYGLGAAVYNNGTLTLDRCTLASSHALGGGGGGGTYGGNGGGGGGGGVYNSGTITLQNCTVTGNSVTGGNGGNAVYGGGGGNAEGGGVYNLAQLQLAACTISANSNLAGLGGSSSFTAGPPGSALGGGVRTAAGISEIRNTIVAGNIATDAPDGSGAFTSQGFNLIGNGAGSTGLGVTCDLVGTTISPLNPMLSPLYDHGGSTPTMLPLPGSLAIDQGDRGGIATDQRGLPRSIDGPIPNSFCSSNASDIGAAEVQPSTIYEWSFDGGDLSATLGPGLMSYADAATPGLTTFSTTDGATVPHIGGLPATYMRVPAFAGLTNGYLVNLTASYPNAGGFYINQYTFIADVLLPITIGYMPFFNSNSANQNDADFYVAPNGAVGIQVYSSPGLITSNTWHRVAFVGNLTASSLTFYVNGIPAQTNNSAPLDGRWALLSAANTGADLLLFNEGDLSGVYTHEVLVAGVALVDRNLNASEIANLGGPAAEGIFVRRLRINRNGPSIVLTWRAAPNVGLQTTSSLQPSNWQSVPGTLGGGAFTNTDVGGAFYRLYGN